MWLVIRWILLPLAVGRRIHPSIGEFKRFKRIGSKKFSKAARVPGPQGGSHGPSAAFDYWAVFFNIQLLILMFIICFNYWPAFGGP